MRPSLDQYHFLYCSQIKLYYYRLLMRVTGFCRIISTKDKSNGWRGNRRLCKRRSPLPNYAKENYWIQSFTWNGNWPTTKQRCDLFYDIGIQTTPVAYMKRFRDTQIDHWYNLICYNLIANGGRYIRLSDEEFVCVVPSAFLLGSFWLSLFQRATANTQSTAAREFAVMASNGLYLALSCFASFDDMISAFLRTYV